MHLKPDQADPSQPIKTHGIPNRLIHERSPYLLQHAYNPVDWHPWGDEAFELARRENRLVFLSVGYSTCHWCHVMEEESFKDQEVAALMNEAFVSIKVDREERPDIDSIYMTAAVMMTGSGGWPLSVILTPDRRPVLAATYIPKNTRYQRPGMLQLIPAIQKIWREEPHRLFESADRITAALQQSAAGGIPGEALDANLLEQASRQLASSFDRRYGGFGGAPKFPTPHRLLFLLRWWKRSGDPQALAMVEKTLQEMRLGGIYDQVGFGFHRYSTDAGWFAPHFEKMLYDQALLVMAYTETYLATGKPEYQATAREIIAYVLRDLRDPGGGFYSAEDADSEGKEGKYYLWEQAELNEILPPDDARFVIETFNLTHEGNFSGEGGVGANILHLSRPLGEDSTRWERLRQSFFARREQRIKPYKDDKILVDWNGLMIAALAQAAMAFGEARFADAARKAADFILSKMRTADGRLLHRYRSGVAGIPASLNDYAYLIWGLLELYEATFDLRCLESALELQKELDDHFWDETGGGYFLTADDAEALLIRPKEIEDSAIPSGNSANMLNLLRLARLSGQVTYEERAEALGKAFSGIVGRYPSSATFLLSALDFAVGPSREVVIVGEGGASDTQVMLSALHSHYLPNMVVLLRNPQGDPGLEKIAGFTAGMKSIDGKATAYVCSNYVCNLPATDISAMLQQLKDW